MIKHPFVYACDLGHALVESYCSHLVAQVVLIRMAPFSISIALRQARTRNLSGEPQALEAQKMLLHLPLR
jgi:hypothetical protein